MTRLVTVSITTAVDDDVDTGAMAEAMFNVAEGPTEEWAEANGWDVTFLDADITLNVESV